MTPVSKSQDDLICLGVIQGPHGLQGEVKLKSYTEDPKKIGAYGPLILKGCADHLTIVKLRAQKDSVFVARFKEVPDRETAELLKHQEVFVHKDKLPKVVDQDVFYVADLEGLVVHSTQTQDIGHVVGVHNYGAGDILELSLKSLSETILVPFMKEWVIEVKQAEGFVVLDGAYLQEYLKPFKKSDEKWDEPK